jgi:hypothetical protein
LACVLIINVPKIADEIFPQLKIIEYVYGPKFELCINDKFKKTTRMYI